jgi:7-carboxy-7-deazaguanine synthase
MQICEIFASIQGESSYAGLPCVFVRLTGCNLRCSYCDTSYAYDGGEEMPAEAIIDTVRSYGIPLVEVTGGEPLLQQGARQLVARLIAEGFTLLIETNGTVSLKDLDPRAVIIMDIKTPGSGMDQHILFENIDLLKPADEAKFVLTGESDYRWAVEFVTRFNLAARCTVLFAPVFGSLSPADLAQRIVRDRLPVRLNLQLHKYIFSPDQRGV